MVIYVFKDTLNKEKVNYAFYSGGKWREDSIELNNEQRKKLMKKRKGKKFGYNVIVVKDFEELQE